MNPTMPPSPSALWDRYRKYLCSLPELNFLLDISRMNFPDDFFASMQPALNRAFEAMDQLETGAIANPDENRMVGHYWLRNPDRAPNPEIAREIRQTIEKIQAFRADVHSGKIRNEKDSFFRKVLVIGIGGSALGPQLAADALGTVADKMEMFFCDNTDPDGMDRLLSRIGPALAETLTLVISKSGTTPETRNGAVEIAAAYRRAGLTFAKATVAVTGDGSALDRQAKQEGWLATFPMWDWVGGRTSELSAVGLLPAALQGIAIAEMLRGAREMDEATRNRDISVNPAALLALMWHYAGNGRGARDMVILPYKDRLVLFSKYLQQLVMESLGKERDLSGNVVHQGIAVYGNKGSTDQHAYVQQLREGVNNFFVTFIEVLRDRGEPGIEVEPGVTTGDFLHGFFLGTRTALFENGRESMTITVPDVSPRTLGMLIALFERAVGLYASLINVNAFHQPGVEAGKKAATAILALQRQVLAELERTKGTPRTAAQIASSLGSENETETIFKILEYLAVNPDRGVVKTPGQNWCDAHYTKTARD